MPSWTDAVYAPVYGGLSIYNLHNMDVCRHLFYNNFRKGMLFVLPYRYSITLLHGLNNLEEGLLPALM